MKNNTPSKTREVTLSAIFNWAKNNRNIRALLLTSSLVNPLAPVDDFSDLDVELVFDDQSKYVLNNGWINHFGSPIAMIEEDDDCFENMHAMKMVLYEDGVKVDFKLYGKDKFLETVQQKDLPEDWDIGYKILLDKDGITREMKPPTYQIALIKKPSEKKFTQVLNDFWWDTTYVAKCLCRDNIFYAKFMSENNIRTEYLIPLIEWHIANQHQWNITTNKHGRLFKEYLSSGIWKKITLTFSNAHIPDNWKALYAMADLVSELGWALSKDLGYEYPTKLESDIRKYLNTLNDSSSRA